MFTCYEEPPMKIKRCNAIHAKISLNLAIGCDLILVSTAALITAWAC